jgi:hypothetical protein
MDYTGRTLPTFDEKDRSLFGIKDAKRRADRQQALLLPRLKMVLDASLDLIRDIYRINTFDDSTIIKRPAHRRNARRTSEYPDAYLGLGPKRNDQPKSYLKPDGEPARFAYFGLKLSLDKDGLRPSLVVSRPP